MKKTIGNFEYDETKDELGRGSFSKVYLGCHVNDPKYKAAIKIMELPNTEGKTKHLLREIELMRHLKHKNVVKLIDVKYEKYGRNGLRLFIIMEYCSKGDMSSLKKPMDEETCQKYFKGIFSGLRYLRKLKIIHRDVKPQNILITENDEVKIADFTFSRQIEENELMETQCGTPLFISPDILMGQAYTDKSDLYSCGVMLYSYIYGAHPLGNVKTHHELLKKIKESKITFPQKLVLESLDENLVLCRTIRTFSQDLIHLMKGLLKIKSIDRISWDEVYNNRWLALEPYETQDIFSSSPQEKGANIDHHAMHACSAPTELYRTELYRDRTQDAPHFNKLKTAPQMITQQQQKSAKEKSNDLTSQTQSKGQTSVKYIPKAISSESPSPINSFEPQWSMEGSSKDYEKSKPEPLPPSTMLAVTPPSLGREGSRIISDYYNSTPLPKSIRAQAQTPPAPSKAGSIEQKSEKIVKNNNNNNQQPKNVDSFLTRSIDAIHKVFSI